MTEEREPASAYARWAQFVAKAMKQEPDVSFLRLLIATSESNVEKAIQGVGQTWPKVATALRGAVGVMGMASHIQGSYTRAMQDEVLGAFARNFRRQLIEARAYKASGSRKTREELILQLRQNRPADEVIYGMSSRLVADEIRLHVISGVPGIAGEYYGRDNYEDFWEDMLLLIGETTKPQPPKLDERIGGLRIVVYDLGPADQPDKVWPICVVARIQDEKIVEQWLISSSTQDQDAADMLRELISNPRIATDVAEKGRLGLFGR